MTKILIINTPALTNKGGMAAVMGAIKSLRESMPDVHVTVLCHHCQEDWDILEQICGRYNIDVKEHPWLKEHNSKLVMLLHSSIPGMLTLMQCMWGRVAKKAGLKPKGIFHESDIILGLDIDTLHENYGIFFPIWTLSNLLLGVVAGKPVVVWGAGIGRFKSKSLSLLTKFVLNKVDMIIVRDEDSKEHVKKLGINKPRIEVTADHAFFMEPAPLERISEIMEREGIYENGNPLIGVSASQMIHRYAFPSIQDENKRYELYLKTMTEMVDYLVAKLNSDVFLIPHSIVSFEDDSIMSKKIHERVKDKTKVKLISGDYMADEFKGVISKCDMFIGSRMHPTIASTSMGIPTIAIVYGEKAHGIIGNMMGQHEFVVEIAKYNPDEFLRMLITKIDQIWTNRDSVASILRERSELAKAEARRNGSLVKGLAE